MGPQARNRKKSAPPPNVAASNKPKLSAGCHTGLKSRRYFSRSGGRAGFGLISSRRGANNVRRARGSRFFEPPFGLSVNPFITLSFLSTIGQPTVARRRFASTKNRMDKG
jgi:hypothetical protein